jgi:hypothetical protein
MVDVIRVGEVSPDLRRVTKVYPGRVRDARITIYSPRVITVFPNIGDLMGKLTFF